MLFRSNFTFDFYKMKRTVVIGASTNPSRYSYKAVEHLTQHGHEAFPIGIKDGKINEVSILLGMPQIEDVHTVSLYVNPQRQPEYYDYIFGLSPGRIIFNPGTQNPELMELARTKGIEVVDGCTLVMLASGEF